MSLLAKRPLYVLAEEINEAYGEIFESYRSALQHAFIVGELLNEAKEQFEHGDWTPWIEQNLRFDPRTAQRYMQLALNRDQLEQYAEQEATRMSDLTLTAALKVVQTPRPPAHAEIAAHVGGMVDDEGDEADVVVDAEVVPELRELPPPSNVVTLVPANPYARVREKMLRAHKDLGELLAFSDDLSAYALGERMDEATVKVRELELTLRQFRSELA